MDLSGRQSLPARIAHCVLCVTVLIVAANAAWAGPYVANRPPLKPSALIKLPIGSIEPQGWLHHQLRLQADGFHGHLTEISSFLKKDGNAWLDAEGHGDHGWEEVPYWLKGYLNCALVLNDKDMLAEAKIWVDGALASQKPDGWFGPDAGRTGVATRIEGRDDLWPNMIMLACLQDWYDATGDPRVIELMTKYFRYLAERPEEQYLLGYWPKMRGGDNLASIYWLYNRTGDEWLLKLAAKNHRQTARWDEGVINWHNVNIGQAFGEPATWWLQSHDPADRQAAYRNWQTVRDEYGQMPGGMFAADENARPGCDDPRQAVETCGMVEEMLSHEVLLAITGDVVWADRCEDVAFNSLPAALTADLKGLRYLTASNMAVSDHNSHSPGIQNGGPMFQMNPHRHRCCQHNWGHGWPYYAQHLWYATPDGGLAAVLYSECEVTARVGQSGAQVTIQEETDYPFDETIRLRVTAHKPVDFPLWLRVPQWCEKPAVTVNGRSVTPKRSDSGVLVLDRSWKSGDRVELKLPAEIRVRKWVQNHGAVSVDRGPLTYALQIAERYERTGGTDRWPAYDILPDSPWNVGLVLDAEDPARSFKLVRGTMPAGDSPWTQENVPLRLQAQGRRIPEWQLDQHGLVAELQDSPVRSDEPVQEITLIPMGAARLRISAFPVIGNGPNAARWEAPQVPVLQYKTDASHTFDGDRVDAIADGLIPKSSNDHSIPRHTFWPHTGTAEWVEARFDSPRTVRAVKVYWFDDTKGGGGCRVPASWRLLYRAGDDWKPVKTDDAYRTAPDRFNTVRIAPVSTRALRVETQLRPDYSAGVLELVVE
jgi:hypothetical protein